MLEKKEVKRLDFDLDVWDLNGNKYYIEPNISAIRYKYYEKYSTELAYGNDFESINNTIGKIINMFNDDQDVQAKAGLYNLYTSMENSVKGKSDRAFRMCSLFLLREGEDPKEYDEKLEKEKINDFIKSGVSYVDFFRLAFNLVPGLLSALENDSQKDSKKGKEKKK
jgi:hypothetical protein